MEPLIVEPLGFREKARGEGDVIIPDEMDLLSPGNYP
jgi:hypothetical protein